MKNTQMSQRQVPLNATYLPTSVHSPTMVCSPYAPTPTPRPTDCCPEDVNNLSLAFLPSYGTFWVLISLLCHHAPGGPGSTCEPLINTPHWLSGWTVLQQLGVLSDWLAQYTVGPLAPELPAGHYHPLSSQDALRASSQNHS